MARRHCRRVRQAIRLSSDGRQRAVMPFVAATPTPRDRWHATRQCVRAPRFHPVKWEDPPGGLVPSVPGWGLLPRPPAPWTCRRAVFLWSWGLGLFCLCVCACAPSLPLPLSLRTGQRLPVATGNGLPFGTMGTRGADAASVAPWSRGRLGLLGVSTGTALLARTGLLGKAESLD